MIRDRSGKNMGGYDYHVTDEQIDFFGRLSVKERLRWLEEAQEFMFSILPPENWETCKNSAGEKFKK